MTSPIFWIGVLTLAGFYGILATILNIEAGWGGLWDLGLAGVLAAGSYFFIIVTLPPTTTDVVFAPGWPLWIAWPATAGFTGLLALVLGSVTLRLRREYFLITTFAFAEIIRQLIIIQSDLTRGSIGFSSFRRPFNDAVVGTDYNYLLLGFVCVGLVVVVLIARHFARSQFGLVLRATRDNEALGLALGKRVSRMRVQTFVLAGVLLGAACPLYLWYVRALTPDLFNSGLTFTVWTALIIGGIGSIRGPVLGALVLIVLTEAMGLIDLGPENANIVAALDPMLVGLLLILVLRFRPDGLLGERGAFRRMNKRTRAHRDADDGSTMEPFVAPRAEEIVASPAGGSS